MDTAVEFTLKNLSRTYIICLPIKPQVTYSIVWQSIASHSGISRILRRWQELQSFYTKVVLTVRNAKFGSLKGPCPPIAQKLCITHSGTAHWLCAKIRAFDPLNNYNCSRSEPHRSLDTNLRGIPDHHNVTLPHCAPSLPPPSPRDYKWVIIEYYKLVFLLFSGLYTAHTKKGNYVWY